MRVAPLVLGTMLAMSASAQLYETPTPEWAAVGTGAGSHRGHDVTSTGAGLVTVVGAFEGQIAFGPLVLLASGAPEGHQDVFVTQFDTDGVPRWARRIATADRDVEPGGIVGGEEGDLYVSGTFDGSVRFQGGSAPAVTLTSAGGRDAFLARYSPDGDLVWAQTMGGPGDDRGHRVAFSSRHPEPDEVLVVGAFEQRAQWGDGDTAQRVTSAGGTDGFLARFHADGSLVSLLTVGGPEDDIVEGVSASESKEEVAVAGSFRGTALLGDTTLTSRGAADAFALRLDAAGVLTDLIHVGGPGDDVGRAAGVREYISSSLGRFLMAGAFRDSVQVGDDVLVSAGETDIFVVGLTGYRTPTEPRFEAYRGGGPGADEALDIGFVEGFYGDIAAFVPVVTGFITGDVTFDSPAFYGSPVPLTGHGGRDGFVASFDYELYTLAALGGSGDDTAWGIGAPLYFSWDSANGLLAGAFEGQAELGTMTIEGAARSDVFVADYPAGELAPYSLASEPDATNRSASVLASPNPARDLVTLLLRLDAEADVTVEIVDVLGRRVAVVHTGRLPAGETRLRPSVGEWAPGAYSVRVSGEVAATGRFVVAR